MAFVWDLIQQIQLHNTKSRAKSARKDAQTWTWKDDVRRQARKGAPSVLSCGAA